MVHLGQRHMLQNDVHMRIFEYRVKRIQGSSENAFISVGSKERSFVQREPHLVKEVLTTARVSADRFGIFLEQRFCQSSHTHNLYLPTRKV